MAGESHGVPRSARQRTEEQKRQDADKIKKYRELEDELRAHIAKKNYSPEVFQLTSRLLRLNPEYYTVWNARRRCLISGLLSARSPGSSPSRASPTSSPSATTTPSPAACSTSSSTAIPPARASPTAGRSGTTAEEEQPLKKEASNEGGENQQKQDSGADSGGEAKDLEILQSELGFTIPLLMEFPKCYWIWNYRLWTLQQGVERLGRPAARRLWEEELGLVSKMLTRDRRNFHAWGYRRHVVAQLESAALGGGSMVEAEFAYTTKMIHVDLSNFSAWHNRSKLIPRLLEERRADDRARKCFLDQELGIIREALNVGPEDQSLWYYHQFLMLNVTTLSNYIGQPVIAPNLTLEERTTYVARELDDVKDLAQDYEGVKWIYEVLLQYTVAWAEMEERPLERDEAADARAWLARLRALDPMRAGRWDDLERAYVIGRPPSRESSIRS